MKRKKRQSKLEIRLATAEKEIQEAAIRFNRQRQDYEAKLKQLKEERSFRELDAKIKLAYAVGQMVDALARSLGGPGF